MRTWPLGIIAFAAICWNCSAALAAPAIEFEKTTFDFGRVTTGHKGKADLPWKPFITLLVYGNVEKGVSEDAAGS